MQSADILKLASVAGAKKYQKGKQIVKAGMKAEDGLCIVLKGMVKIIHHHGTSSLVLGSISAGQFFGEYSLVLNRPLDIDAFAEEDDTIVLFVDQVKFMHQAHKNPALIKALFLTAVTRIGYVIQTGSSLGNPIQLIPEPGLVKVIQENRSNNLRLLSMVNNTRSAFVAKDRAVFRQTEPNNGEFFLVTEGSITAVFKSDIHEGTVTTFFPGDIFGFSRPANNPLRPYTALSEHAQSRVMGFAEDFMLKLLSIDLECFYSVFRTVVTQIVMLDHALHQSVSQLQTEGTTQAKEKIIFQLLHGKD